MAANPALKGLYEQSKQQMRDAAKEQLAALEQVGEWSGDAAKEQLAALEQQVDR